jgi:hypothetical protein
MASKDLVNKIQTVALIPPAAAIVNANTAVVSNIIDTAGFESASLVLITGGETDADATFAVTLEHGDAANLSDTSVPSGTDLIGTAALASFTFANDNITRKIGYIGSKRYLRLTVTPSANDAGSFFIAGVAILGHPRNAPTANPPTT